MESPLKATKLKNVEARHLAPATLLKSDEEWEQVTPPMDGILDPAGSNLKNLKITCATCGVGILPADVGPGLLHCPDCDSDAFLVTKLLEPEIISGKGMWEAWVTNGGYVFIYLREGLPADAEIRCAVDGSTPNRKSALYQKPFLCPKDSSAVQFIICLGAKLQTPPQTIHIKRRSFLEGKHSYTCPICKQKVYGVGEHIECPSCGFARVFSQGLSADIYPRIRCGQCGKHFHPAEFHASCPHCGTRHFFYSGRQWRKLENGQPPPPPPASRMKEADDDMWFGGCGCVFIIIITLTVILIVICKA